MIILCSRFTYGGSIAGCGKLPDSVTDEWVLGRLRKICKYAQQHVPFYHDWFQKHNFVSDQLTSFEYYRELPVLDKDACP